MPASFFLGVARFEGIDGVSLQRTFESAISEAPGGLARKGIHYFHCIIDSTVRPN